MYALPRTKCPPAGASCRVVRVYVYVSRTYSLFHFPPPPPVISPWWEKDKSESCSTDIALAIKCKKLFDMRG